MIDDERLIRRLQVVDEPVNPDPAFADELYATLATQLGFEGAAGEPRLTPRRIGSRRRPRWLPPLLVAALLVGGGLAAMAGAGGLLVRHDLSLADVPNLCQLVTPAEIGAVIGASVSLDTTHSSDFSTRMLAGRSCAYSYPAGGGTLIVRNLEITITRSADPTAAWTELRTGAGAVPVEGVGDAAVLYPAPAAAPEVPLYVVKGPYILSVSYLQGGGQSVSPQQMQDIARLLLARLA